MSVAVPEAQVLADADRALARHVWGLAMVAMVAFVLAWVVGHIMLVRPLNALVLATRRLAAGLAALLRQAAKGGRLAA